MDVETLESRRSWASLSKRKTVVLFHLPPYELVLKKYTKLVSLVTPSDPTFATRLVAVFMFVKVKGCRRMTY